MGGRKTGRRRSPEYDALRGFPPQADSHGRIFSPRMTSVEATRIAGDYRSIMRDSGIPSGCEGLSDADKCLILQRCGPPTTRIPEPPNLGDQRDAILAFSGPLRPGASGMWNYFKKSRLRRSKSFLAQTDTILMWIRLFRPCGGFAQHLARVAHASMLVRKPPDWITPDIRPVFK